MQSVFGGRIKFLSYKNTVSDTHVFFTICILIRMLHVQILKTNICIREYKK